MLTSDYKVKNLKTGVVSTVSDWSMCFDHVGAGRQTITMSNGATCGSDVTASFSGSDLVFEDGANVPCSDKFMIYKRKIQRARTGGETASCVSSQEEIGSTGPVEFRRRANASQTPAGSE